MSTRVTRRSFLRGAAGAGVGAAAASAAGGLVVAPTSGVADAAPIKLRLPPAPSGHAVYVSRPDLRPPAVKITRAGSFAGSPKYIFVSPRVAPTGGYPKGAQRGLLILDEKGNVVWFRPMPGKDNDPFNFRVQRYKGRPVLTWYQGIVGPGYGVGGTYVIADSSYQQVTSFHAVGYPGDLHEFLITGSDSAWITAYAPDRKLNVVVGHAQEIDVATRALIWDWASYPTVPTSQSFTGRTGDYFHINSIDVWPGGDVLISARNTSSVYLVSKATKKILWQVGGKRSSFHRGPGAQFEFQHDARALPGGSGISVFDNASRPSSEKQAWGKVISLNMRTRQATLRHEYNHSTAPIRVVTQGNLQVLANGGHFIGWGAEPYFSEYAPSGRVVQGPQILDGRFPSGVESYRAYKFDWIASPPQSEIALVVQKGSTAGSFKGFASWNGATEIAVWTIQAGTSTSNLVTAHTSSKSSFETRLDFTHSGATQFRATAWNAKGKAIGSSNVVTAT